MSESFAADYFRKVKSLIDQLDLTKIERAIAILEAAWPRDQQVLIVGNGGSASTASHYACDLHKVTARPGRNHLKVMSLCDNMALFSAVANDFGYEHVFVEQLKHVFKPGDVLIGISVSGNSQNVVKAFEYARAAEGKTIAIVGLSGGRLAALADCAVHIPYDEYGPVEDVQLMINHLIVDYFRQTVVAVPDTFGATQEGVRI